MKILYKRGYVEYHSSLYANVLKEYNLQNEKISLSLSLCDMKKKEFRTIHFL